MIGSIPFFEKSEEATIKSAENAIRIILLINGGAAVSVLAFVGSLASKDRVTTTQLYAMAGSLVWFTFGVASSALSAFFSYLTNFSYLFATLAKQPSIHFTNASIRQMVPNWENISLSCAVSSFRLPSPLRVRHV